MRRIASELKKHVSFRETWVGYILGTFYLVSALAAYWDTIQYAPQRCTSSTAISPRIIILSRPAIPALSLKARIHPARSFCPRAM